MIDKRKAIISDGLYSADSLFLEGCCYNAGIEFEIIGRNKVILSVKSE